MSYLPGRPAIPAQFGGFALTDRADGTVWLLMADTTGYVKLTTPVSSRFIGRTYSAYNGPYLDTHFGSVKLLVRDGALGYEHPVPNANSRPMLMANRARATLNDTFFQLLFSDSQPAVDGALSYETEVTL